MRSRHDREWCNRPDNVASHYVIEVKVDFRSTGNRETARAR
jgi:hypothetical protein